MSGLDAIPELIEQADKFTYANFSSKSGYGFPNAFSEDWIVWTHHVRKVVEQIGPASAAGAAIDRGLNFELLGNGQEEFNSALNSIRSGLKAASRIYSEQIPASDRLVSIGHNSPERQEALDKIDEVIAAVREANDLPGDEQVKDQLIAELSAARRLLEAAKVRLLALKSTLAPPLKWLLEKAAGSFVGKAASSAWDFFAGFHIF
ncbi:hypothetical protein N2605_23690 [Bradyrhizobium yuanmingense]|uniref:hypothetical protein n=1 Tax=Bradyrhizobium yuanmingense TaxID=108015 RepID=UPI0021A8DF21|nr:hypothetical protein [Bradyrhizobium sp. CB1024]UWU82599.1 hypothetical protein N2605_23690 [Bradyrhizobium sp. CB1024]